MWGGNNHVLDVVYRFLQKSNFEVIAKNRVF